jgi:hypothetical protein
MNVIVSVIHSSAVPDSTTVSIRQTHPYTHPSSTFWQCIFTNLTSSLINWLGRYARLVDRLAVKNVAQGAPQGGGSTLHSLSFGLLYLLRMFSFLVFIVQF